VRRYFKRVHRNETHWAENLSQAVARLREQSYSTVVIDQFLLENEPAESDQVLEHLGTAFPVYVNFGVSAWSDWFARFAPHCTAANARKRRLAARSSNSFAVNV